MTRNHRPPRLARAILEYALPDDEREGVSGDLEEVFQRDRRKAGATRARMRYWQATLSFARHFLVEQFQERGSMRVRMSWIDVKLGIRMLLKYPGLTLVGGLGIAVGIAISIGMFAFFYSHLYPRLPLPEGDRIVALENWNVRVNNEERRSLHDFAIWRSEMTTVREIGAFRTITSNLILPGQSAQTVQIAEITAVGLQAARVPPLMGRTLVETDERDGAAPVVVIGNDVWRARFSGNPDVVGSQVRLGNTMHTVVGVMPAEFRFPVSHQFWTPFTAKPVHFPRGQGPRILVFGRLAPGISAEQAQAEFTVIGQRAAAMFPETNQHLRAQVLPYTYPITDIQDVPSTFLGTTQLAVGLVLLVVCVNLAVLVYARTATRNVEIAVRSALGASRMRIVGQFFVEALVLAAVPAIAGLAIGQFGVRLGNQIMGDETDGEPFWVEQGVLPETLLYLAGLTVLVAVIVGVVPALQATGRRLQAGLRQLGGTTKASLGRTWTVLIVAQVAIAVAALPTVAVLALNEVPDAASRPAFASQEFLAAIAVVEPQVVATNEEASRQERMGRFARFRAELASRLDNEPAVAGLTFSLNFPGTEPGELIEAEGIAPPPSSRGHMARVGRVASNFFEVLNIPVVAGRAFQPGDEESASPERANASRRVLVNETFARRVMGNANAVGRRIRYVPSDDEQQGPWLEIAGVVRDLHSNQLEAERDSASVFHLLGPSGTAGGYLTLHIRSGDPESFIPRLREVATAIDPSMRIPRIGPFDTFQQQDRLAVLLVAVVFSLISATVLLLSAAGIYALMSFTVTQRRREIGIRAALGADPRQVIGSIFGRAIKQLAMGVVVGGVLVAGLDRALNGEILGGKAPFLVPAMVLVMCLVGLLAALGPARRALRIQPTGALRDE